MKKKILSLALCIVMVLSIVPTGVFTLPVAAASCAGAGTEASPYLITSREELEEVLTAIASTTKYLKITKDIDVFFEDFSDFKTIEINGNVVFDLNGHLIRYKVESIITVSGYIYENTLFNVPVGSTVILDDSVGGGEIIFDRKHLSLPTEQYTSAFMLSNNLTVFEVNGTLITKNCEITAGHYKSEHYSFLKELFSTKACTFQGYVDTVVAGNAVVINNGGSFTSYGGEYYGRGLFQLNEIYESNALNHCASVVLNKGSSATIYDGEFYGKSNADVFQVDDGADIQVYGGYFHAEYNGRITYEKGYVDDKVHFVKTNCGKIGIPLRAFDNGRVGMTGIYIDGEEYNYSTSYTTEEDTAFQALGEESKGLTMSVKCKKLSSQAISTTGTMQGSFYPLGKNGTKKVSCVSTVGSYYPSTDSYLSSRITKQYEWTALDNTTKEKYTFTSSTDKITIYTYLNNAGALVSGHIYTITCTYCETYTGTGASYSLEKTTYNSVDIYYYDIAIPTAGAFAKQIAERSSTSEKGYVTVFVTLTGVEDETKITVQSPFSSETYSKTVTKDGTYGIDVTDSAIALNGPKTFKYYLTVTDDSGMSVTSEKFSCTKVLVPWISSSASSSYLHDFSEEVINTGSLTLYSNYYSTWSSSNYSVQWMSATISGGTWGDWTAVSGATGKTYTVSGSTLTKQTAYYAKITYTNSSTGETATGHSNVIMVTPAALLDDFYVDVQQSGTEASPDSPVSLTAGSVNATGTVKYYWYIKDGPDGFTTRELSGNTSYSSNSTISFPLNSTSNWVQNLKPGDYSIYCKAYDSGSGTYSYSTPVTVHLSRPIESVKIYADGYDVTTRERIYMKSENDVMYLKYEVTPAFTDEEYYVEYSGYDDTITVNGNTVIPQSVGSPWIDIKIKNSADDSVIASYSKIIRIPISTIDVYLYDEPTEGGTATTDGISIDSDETTYQLAEKYWNYSNHLETPLAETTSFIANNQYAATVKLTSTSSLFAVNDTDLKNYYESYTNFSTNYSYIDTSAIKVRWHLDETNPDSYVENPENSYATIISPTYDGLYCTYIFPTTKSYEYSYLKECQFNFNAPQPGETVTLKSIDGVTKLTDLFTDVSTLKGRAKVVSVYTTITDLTTDEKSETTVTLEAGHQYQFRVCLKPYYSDICRFEDDMAIYLDGELVTDALRLSNETIYLTYTFIPGVGSYVETEKIYNFNYGAGLTAPRIGTLGTNELGNKLNDDSTCTITNILYSCDGVYNSFLPGGMFKRNTTYTAKFSIIMSDEHEDDEFYNLKSITLCSEDDEGEITETTYSGSQITVENKGKQAVVTVNLGNSGTIRNTLSFDPLCTLQGTEGYSSVWAFENRQFFTLHNYSEDTLTDITVTSVEGTDEYFKFIQPEDATLDEGEATSFYVYPKAGLPAGDYSGAFNITYTGSDSETHTQQATIYFEVLDRDWYYLYGEVILPDEFNHTDSDYTHIKLLKTDGTETGIEKAVYPFNDEYFTLSNIPAGEYIVEASRDDAQTLSTVVSITGDTSVLFDFTDGSLSQGTDVKGISVSKTRLSQGETVDVTIKVPEQDEAINTFSFIVKYDSDIFEIVDDWSMTDLNSAFTQTTNYNQTDRTGYGYTATENTVLGGTEFTATFRVKAGVATTATSFEVSSISATYLDDSSAQHTKYLYSTSGICNKATVVILCDGDITISGNVLSIGNTGLTTTAQLLSATGSVLKEMNGSGTTVPYEFAGLNAGEYFIGVSKPGYVERHYGVTVETDSIIKNAELYEQGDTNGDGEININDYTNVVNTALGSNNAVKADLTANSDYAVAVADMDGDGVVDVLDCCLIERKIN